MDAIVFRIQGNVDSGGHSSHHLLSRCCCTLNFLKPSSFAYFAVILGFTTPLLLAQWLYGPMMDSQPRALEVRLGPNSIPPEHELHVP